MEYPCSKRQRLESEDVPEGFPEEFIAIPEECIEIVMDGVNEGKHYASFAHQVFPRKRIFGYKELVIKITYTCKWRMLVRVSFERMLEGRSDPHPFTSISSSPAGPKGGGITDSEDVFAKWKAEDEDMELPCDEREKDIVWISNLGKRVFGKELLSRMQAMSVWWIETSEQTDATDSSWSLILSISGKYITGFTSVFEFSNPFTKRPKTWRICQSVVFPCFQKKGFGRQMLEYVYKRGRDSSDVYEINVEDPCPEFILLRDLLEVQQCVKYACFVASDNYTYKTGMVPSIAVNAIHDELKITNSQIQRCYEILRFIHTEHDEESSKQFKRDLIRRFYKQDVEGVQSNRETLSDNLDLLYLDIQRQYAKVKAKLPKSILRLI